MGNKLTITFQIKPDGAWREAKGRDAWALLQLATAGNRGVTPIQNPAPRWSAYVHNLRKMGMPIETIHEAHGGAFAGTHARYVLRADINIESEIHG